jgi:hypothetical protein
MTYIHTLWTNSGRVFRLGIDRFLPNPFQFINLPFDSIKSTYWSHCNITHNPSLREKLKVKVKPSLYRPWRLLGLWEVKAPTFSDIRRINDGKVVSRTRRPLLPPGRFLVLIFVGGWVDPRVIVQLEGLCKFKESTLSGTRTGYLPACSIVPQPTTLPRAPDGGHSVLYCI